MRHGRIVLPILCLVLLAAEQAGAQRWRERRAKRQAEREAKAAAAAPAATGLVTRITTLKEGGARLDWIDSKIAFDMLGPGDVFAVYVMRPDGSDVKCLTCNNPDLPKRNVGQPAWHPSGRYLALQAEKAQHQRMLFGHAMEPGAGVMNDLWVLDTTTNRATPIRQVGDAAGQGTLHPHFSDDGTMLSWSEMQAKAGLRKSQELGYWQLMVADFRTDGGKPHLENINSVTPGGPGFYENHGFSPDGSRLIFTSNFEAKRRVLNDIYTMDLRSRKLSRLTTDGYNEHAIFSPDGRSIAWISTTGNPSGGTDFWIMNSDGSNKRRLTYFNQKGHPEYVGQKVVVADISWRPDGTAFAGYYREGGAIESKSHPTKIILVELRLR
jgi:Tol biopolymer transport system component